MTHPYTSETYARAFTEHSPFYLPHSQSWVLQRAIPQSPYHDITACYPRFPLFSPQALADDLKHISQQAVSFTLATDATTPIPADTLSELFDVVRPFKIHYLHTNEKPRELTKHHRYEVKQAHRHCTVNVVAFADYLAPWLELYQNLVKHHQITGFQNFNEQYFTQLLQTENLITLGAFDVNNNLIAMHLWYQYQDTLYSHLAASSDQGYQLRASYAIYDTLIREFPAIRTIDFGSGAGNSHDPNNGLTRFKQGFANDSQQSYLCGKILDQPRYNELVNKTFSLSPQDYFPLYRKG